MKILFLPVLLYALCALLSCVSNGSVEKNELESKVSGAYEALNWLGSQRTYPSNGIPLGSLSEAWTLHSKLNESSPQRADSWESIGPHNKGGRMLSIAFNPLNPKTIFAGSASGGLWKSTSEGLGAEAWKLIETGFPVLGVSCIAIQPSDSSTLFIGTGEVYNYQAAGTGVAYRNTRGSYGMGILKSQDGGMTWTKSLDWTYESGRGIWDIKIHPQNPSLIYTATTHGVYKTIDGGIHWEQVLDVVLANSLVLHPTDTNLVLIACGNFGSPGYGIYKTTNGGNSWSKISSGLPFPYNGKVLLGGAPSNPEVVYASIGDGFNLSDGASWLCRSEDFGSNWIVKNTEDYSKWQGWYAHDVAVNPTNEELITVIGIDVWNSNNGGDSLFQSSVNTGSYSNPSIEGPDGHTTFVHADCHDVVYSPLDPNTIYIASDGGIFRSADGGKTFRSCNGGLQTTQFYNGTSNSHTDPEFYLGGLQDNGTIRWNGDKTWRRIFGGDGSWTAVDPNNDDIVFVSYQWLNIARSVNKANSFDLNATPPLNNDLVSFIAPYKISPSNTSTLYAGSSKIYRSDDTASTWYATNQGMELDGNPVLSMDISFQNENVVYAATAPVGIERGHVFYTGNGGVNWQDITTTLPDRYPMDLAVDPQNDSTAYVAFSGFGTGHVFKTSDAGQNWLDISDELPDLPTNAIVVDPVFPNHIYVGNDFGVYVSTDGGLQWSSYQEGLPATLMVFDLCISPSNRKLRIASHGNGSFQRDLLEDVVSAVDIIKNQKNILNTYPNPFSESFRINLSDFTERKGVLELFNLNGQLVFNKSFTGNEQLEVRSGKLVPGTYTLVIRQGNEYFLSSVIKI